MQLAAPLSCLQCTLGFGLVMRRTIGLRPVLGKWLHKFIGWFLFGYPHLISAVKGTKGQIIIHVHTYTWVYVCVYIPRHPHRHGKPCPTCVLSWWWLSPILMMTMITCSSLSPCYHVHRHNQNVISAGGRWASFRGLVMLTFSFWYLTIQWPFRCRESTSGVSTTVRWEDNCRWPPPFLGDHSDGCGKYGEDITLMKMMMMMMMTLSMLRSTSQAFTVSPIFQMM